MVTTLPADPLIGVVLDERYRITSCIGIGGCGVVYRARQVIVDRDVAVKLLSHEASMDPDMARRFDTEARIISQLRHPNTLKSIDFGRAADGRLYIVTEFLAGAPMDVALHDGPLAPARVVRILAQVCDSLTEAHEHGIVHRDLKPGNIFLERVGSQEIVKVLDFGIARLAEQATRTATGRIFGTPAYMSPEQARGEPVDARSDLYSLGVVAYQALAGVRPFNGETPVSFLLKHLQEPPPPLRGAVPDVDPELEALVMGLLAKRVADRPASAAEVRHRLAELELRLMTRRAAPAPAPGSRPSAPDGAAASTHSLHGELVGAGAAPAGRRRLVFAALAACAVLGVAAAWLGLRREAPVPDPPSITTSSPPEARPQPIAPVVAAVEPDAGRPHPVEPPAVPTVPAAVEPPRPAEAQPSPAVAAGEPVEPPPAVAGPLPATRPPRRKPVVSKPRPAPPAAKQTPAAAAKPCDAPLGMDCVDPAAP